MSLIEALIMVCLGTMASPSASGANAARMKKCVAYYKKCLHLDANGWPSMDSHGLLLPCVEKMPE